MEQVGVELVEFLELCPPESHISHGHLWNSAQDTLLESLKTRWSSSFVFRGRPGHSMFLDVVPGILYNPRLLVFLGLFCQFTVVFLRDSNSTKPSRPHCFDGPASTRVWRMFLGTLLGLDQVRQGCVGLWCLARSFGRSLVDLSWSYSQMNHKLGSERITPFSFRVRVISRNPHVYGGYG